MIELGFDQLKAFESVFGELGRVWGFEEFGYDEFGECGLGSGLVRGGDKVSLVFCGVDSLQCVGEDDSSRCRSEWVCCGDGDRVVSHFIRPASESVLLPSDRGWLWQHGVDEAALRIRYLRCCIRSSAHLVRRAYLKLLHYDFL